MSDRQEMRRAEAAREELEKLRAFHRAFSDWMEAHEDALTPEIERAVIAGYQEAKTASQEAFYFGIR